MQFLLKRRRLVRSSFACIAVTLSLAACDTPALVSSPLAPIGSEKLDKRLIGAWYALSAQGDDNSGISMLTLGIADAENGPPPASLCMFGASPGDVDPEDEFSATPGETGSICKFYLLYPVEFDGETFLVAKLTWQRARLDIEGPDDADDETSGNPDTVQPDHPAYLIAKAEIRADGNLVVSPLMNSDIETEATAEFCHIGCETINVLSEEELARQIRNADPGEILQKQFIFARVPEEFPLQSDTEG